MYDYLLENQFQCQNRHRNNPLNIVCLQEQCKDDNLICAMCHYERHNHHQTIPLQIFIKSQNIEICSSSIDFTNSFQEHLETKKAEIYSHINQIETKNKDFINLLINKVQKQFNRFLSPRNIQRTIQLRTKKPVLTKNQHQRQQIEQNSEDQSNGANRKTKRIKKVCKKQNQRKQNNDRKLRLRNNFVKYEKQSQIEPARDNQMNESSYIQLVYRPQNLMQKSKHQQNGQHQEQGRQPLRYIDPNHNCHIKQEQHQSDSQNSDDKSMPIVNMYEEQIQHRPWCYPEQIVKRQFLNSMLGKQTVVQRVLSHRHTPYGLQYLYFFANQFSWQSQKELVEESIDEIQNYWKRIC